MGFDLASQRVSLLSLSRAYQWRSDTVLIRTCFSLFIIQNQNMNNIVEPGTAESSRLERFVHLLSCPRCLSTLDLAQTSLICQQCQRVYPILGGVPDFLSSGEGQCLADSLQGDAAQRMREEYLLEEASSTAGPKWDIKSVLPQIMLKYDADFRNGPARKLFEGDGDPLVLNVGGGPNRETPKEITLNISNFNNVDLVADAHHIPFADNSFDGVYSLAVLEHVTSPHEVVAEMIRVLKPGGYLYSEVPFMFFFHGYPSDYTRVTQEGMKLMFSGLEDVEVGMSHGPVSAVLQSANMVVPMLLPASMPVVRRLGAGLFRLLFFPLKYLDLLLRDHPDAHTVAGGFYVVGRKPT